MACAATLAQEPADRETTRGFDPAHTRFRFDVRTRWGQHVGGTFPRYEGALTRLADGRQQVRVVLDSDAVQVAGPKRYGAYARGPKFFDAQRHPQIRFVSEPHAPALLRSGGRLRGTVRLHGVERIETFEVEPARCDAPGEACDVVARGSVSRGAYGMDAWKAAVSDRVLFTLRVRYAERTP